MTQDIPATEVGPDQGMIFSALPVDENGNQVSEPFTPQFYPDRLNETLEKKLRKEGNQCKGQDVHIENFKNPTLHVTGICLSSEVDLVRELHRHDGEIDLITPISPNGGFSAYAETVEVGEIEGWNPEFQQWMFKYTIDFVSTGEDEYNVGEDDNDIVTTLLNQ